MIRSFTDELACDIESAFQYCVLMKDYENWTNPSHIRNLKREFNGNKLKEMKFETDIDDQPAIISMEVTKYQPNKEFVSIYQGNVTSKQEKIYSKVSIDLLKRFP